VLLVPAERVPLVGGVELLPDTTLPVRLLGAVAAPGRPGTANRQEGSSARLAASAVFRAARVPGFRSTTFCMTAAPSKSSARVSASERVASASSRAGRHAIWKVGNSNAASARFSDIGSQSEPRIDLRSQ